MHQIVVVVERAAVEVALDEAEVAPDEAEAGAEAVLHVVAADRQKVEVEVEAEVQVI